MLICIGIRSFDQTDPREVVGLGSICVCVGALIIKRKSRRASIYTNYFDHLEERVLGIRLLTLSLSLYFIKLNQYPCVDPLSLSLN